MTMWWGALRGKIQEEAKQSHLGTFNPKKSLSLADSWEIKDGSHMDSHSRGRAGGTAAHRGLTAWHWLVNLLGKELGLGCIHQHYRCSLPRGVYPTTAIVDVFEMRKNSSDIRAFEAELTSWMLSPPADRYVITTSCFTRMPVNCQVRR